MTDIQKSSILAYVTFETAEEISHLLPGTLSFNIEFIKKSSNEFLEKECLEKIYSNKYNVLIIDACFFSIQDKLNFTLLYELTILVPVIVIGGKDTIDIENKIREEKIFYYLVKPIEPEELIKVLEEAIKWSQTKNCQGI